MHGLLVINKPAGITSRHAVDVVQGWFPGVRMGHAGTLDPAATGVLVVCLGDATRLTEYVQRMPKTYRATVLLGATSDTDDAVGNVQPVAGAVAPTESEVRRALAEFRGEIEQTPPAHSAAHVAGRRAYQLARRGQSVELAGRRVHIYGITLVRYAYPTLELVVECGKGTYIRSLARDLGWRLGCGGLLQGLERTRIGPFHLQDSLGLDAGPESARQRLLAPGAAVADLPQRTLEADQIERLRQGQRVCLNDSPGWDDGVEVAIFVPQGALAAVTRWSSDRRELRPLKVLSRSSP
jgi:tRNA pseudouridine55 synthase